MAKRHLKANEFWKFLDAHGIRKDEKVRTKHSRYRRFPPLPEARETFLRMHPWWKGDWDDADQWELPPEMAERAVFHDGIGREEQDEEEAN